MTATRVSIGPVTTGFNAAIQPTAGSHATGDVIVAIFAAHLGSPTISTPGGWTDVGDSTGADQTRVFAIVATSSSMTMPSIQFGTDYAWAYVVVYRGVTLSAAFAAAGRQSNTTQNIVGTASSRTPSAAGSVVLFIGNRNKTTTTDGETYTPPTNFTLVQQHAQNGTKTSSCLCEWIQTTATVIPANSAASSNKIESTAQAQEALLLALLASVTPGPQYTADPAVTSLTSTQAVIGQTFDSDCTAYAVAVAQGSTTPSVAQVKAGQNGSGGAAVSATNSAATAATPKSLTLTGLTAGTAYDFYFAGSNVNGDTALKSILNQTPPVVSTLAASFGVATVDGYRLDFTPGGTGTVSAIALIKGSATPTAAQIKAGSPTGFLARVTQAATNGVPGSVLFTGLTFPLADLYILITVTGVDSSITSFLNQQKLPAAGRQYSSLGTLSSSSPFKTVTPALTSQDILDMVATSPSGYAITPNSVGDLLVSAGGDESRELLGFNFYDTSVGAMYYTADSTLAVNDLRPVANADPNRAFTFIFAKNAVISQTLTGIFSEPEGDAMTLTETTAVLAGLGLSISGTNLVGTTPNAFSITEVGLRAADPYLGTSDVLGLLIVGQVQVPNPAGLLRDDYAPLIASEGLIIGDTTWVLSLIPVGQVVSTSPAYPTFVDVGTEVDITASGIDPPDITGFPYADAQLILEAEGLQIFGGPFPGIVLTQNPAPGQIVAPGTLIAVSTFRVYGVDIGDMQPSNVSLQDIGHDVQLSINSQQGLSRLELLQALQGITNYIRSKKFPP